MPAIPPLDPVLPALGYRPEQVAELAATVAAVPCDLVLSATPVDLAGLLRTKRPVVRVSCTVEEAEGAPLRGLLLQLLRS